MYTHKEVKVEVGDHLVRAALCDMGLYHEPMKYRWQRVTCPKCLGMKPLLEERAKEQTRKWQEENNQ